MLGLREWAGIDNPAPAVLVAVALSALYGGAGPGILALGLATLVIQDPVALIAGAVLAAICSWFGRLPPPPRGDAGSDRPIERSEGGQAGPAEQPTSGSFTQDRGQASSGLPVEVTSEATWRFRHDQPLDITLPEDEQVEHLYLYSVLAECNDAFARMYGFRSAADVVGTRLVVFLPPSNPENVAYLRTYIRSGYRLEDAESKEVDRYGRAKYFVNNLVGIFERGQLVGSWGTQRDVTETRTSDQEYSSRLHSTKSSSQ
jgi:PAS domain S-box-containing protein